ncbi:PseG/SpsG family protein [Acetobacterium malicum]|uniref:PseG/SpsG family protein n=1 Tax=Acetobacterium malicum TaxID=52692 RepID=UPI0004099E3C|nr:glycosyltransferase [Acetobacterium dehalogenans]
MGMNLNIKIFTEGGEKIGFGHISRCTALYDEAIRQGIPVELFILNNEFGNNENSLLQSRKVSFVNWQDPDYLLKNLDKNDLCIVDSYLASIEIYELIAELSKKALYLDDYGRLDYPEGIVVNPSLNTAEIEYKQKQNCEYLLGEQYIILRTAFLGKKKSCLNKRIEHVLITLGGADPLNLTVSITNLLREKYPELVLNVVFGKQSQLIEELEQFENVKVYHSLNGEKMCDLMMQADIAITAAGQTIHELMALNIPFICIRTADNQGNNIYGLKQILEKKLILDGMQKDFEVALLEAFIRIETVRESCHDANQSDAIIDGLGVKRIIKNLLLS